MNSIDYSMEEYQNNVLRTANRELDWQETVENCLLGLIGELGEVVSDLNSNNPLFVAFADIAQIAEGIKKQKYHSKPMDLSKYTVQRQVDIEYILSFKPNFNVAETANLKKELGDLLYYQTWLIDTLGMELAEVAQENVEKLRKRYATGFSVEQSLNRKE